MSAREYTKEFPAVTRLWFYSEEFEDDNIDYIEIWSGYELDNYLEKYYTGKINELFMDVHHAVLLRIEYVHKSNDLDFTLNSTMNDGATVSLNYNQKSLTDKNAKILNIIRDLVDYDPETENLALKQFVENC